MSSRCHHGKVPDGIGDSYTYRVVHPGGCTFPGCEREALVFCAEHAHLLSILDQLGQRIARLEQPKHPPGSPSSPGARGDAPRPVHGGGVGGNTATDAERARWGAISDRIALEQAATRGLDERIEAKLEQALLDAAQAHDEAVAAVARAEKAEAERDEALGRAGFGLELLDRAVLQGGCESWDESQLRDWCCDYKDFKNGLGPDWIRAHADHENCTHRHTAPPGTPLTLDYKARAEAAERERDRYLERAVSAEASVKENERLRAALRRVTFEGLTHHAVPKLIPSEALRLALVDALDADAVEAEARSDA